METIGEWLNSLGLGAYASSFMENDIDVSILAEVTDQSLKDIGVASVGHRLKLLRAIAARGAPATVEGHSPATAVAPDAQAAEAKSASEISSRPASGAERRHLTVMFCDLVGSTALAARLDPEDVREVVRAYQGACALVIGKYEGFVAQYLGDGIMAYFGYPQAHEDDAERAVRAGLDLITAVAKLDTKTKVEVRVGIATGLVVVGDLIGEHAAKERAVTGETPNLAARLQGLAAPGSIVVAAATRRLLGAMFDLRDLGAQQVKGLDAPAQAFAVEGVRSFESRFEARAGGLTGFVGREEEGEHLLARKKLAWQGRGQCVLVSGEAGIGKSRLTAWLTEELAGEPHTRLRYQCTPHHKDSALYPAIAQLERAVTVDAGTPAGQKLDKLEAVLALAGLDTRAIAPLFAALLAIPMENRYPPLDMSPGQQRQRTLAAMLDQIDGLARQKPVLMVYEDAHWADATSLELLDMLVDRIAQLPVLVVVTGRPEFSPAWAGRHNVTTLALTRLDRRHARAMVENVSGATLPAEVLDHILAKTDGVPLFVEELTKTVLESGLLIEDGQSYRVAGPLPAMAIPATLQDSLMARLDRSNPVKEIAQIGAAIGREFSYKLLLAVAGSDEATVTAGLAKLEESELATRRGVPPEATYTFKHALVQDAAYESLLKSRRQTIHRRIAKALRDRFPVLADTEPETLAHHFTQAGRATQAIEWWTKAADLGVRRFAYAEAIGHYERAIALADELPFDPATQLARVRLQIAFGRAVMAGHGYQAPLTARAFHRALALADGLDEGPERFAIYQGFWVGSFNRAEPGPMQEMADALLRGVIKHDGSLESAGAHQISGMTRGYRGDYTGARDDLEKAAAEFAAYKAAYGRSATPYVVDIGVASACLLARMLWALGDVRRAGDLMDTALADAAGIGHVPTFVQALWSACMLERMRLDPARALPHAMAELNLAREHGLPYWLPGGHMASGWARWRAGEHEAGEAGMRRGEALRRQLGFRTVRPQFALMTADVEARSGRPEQALSLLDDVLAENSETKQSQYDAELHRERAGILLQLSPPDRSAAGAALLRSLQVARAQQTRTFELRAALDLARLYCDAGRERPARDLLVPALVGFTETPELPEIGEAQRLLTSLGGEFPRASGQP